MTVLHSLIKRLWRGKAVSLVGIHIKVECAKFEIDISKGGDIVLVCFQHDGSRFTTDLSNDQAISTTEAGRSPGLVLCFGDLGLDATWARKSELPDRASQLAWQLWKCMERCWCHCGITEETVRRRTMWV